MKPTEITSCSHAQDEIDWSEPMWVISKTTNKIVCATGSHGRDSFTGFALPCERHPEGLFSTDWAKSSFQPIKGELTIKISN